MCGLLILKMMRSKKATIVTFAERCKNILASNWQGCLNTIQADAKGSKESIYTSKVKYIIKKGKPYIWVPEKDLHNVNTIIDERGSFAVTSPFPGSLANILKSMEKLPARVALIGDVIRLSDTKVQSATEILRETIFSEQKAISEWSYSVSSILSSSNHGCKFRNENLQELLDGGAEYVVYKLDIRSCMFVDRNGGHHEVDLEEIAASKADKFSPFSANLLHGINQSEVRRRALMLFCLVYLDAKAKDAYMVSIDRKGFDVLAKVPRRAVDGGFVQYHWEEFRFAFKEEAFDIETACRLLVEMEEKALKNISSFSGLE